MALPQQTENWHATQCQFWQVVFYVQRAGMSKPRRIQETHRPHQNGADTRDMGGDSLKTTINAFLTKTQVEMLEVARDSAIPHLYRDPTRGTYQARLVDVASVIEWNRPNWYQASLTFVKDKPGQFTHAPKKPANAQQSASTAAGLFNDGLDDLGDAFPDGVPDNVTDASGVFSAGLTDFDNAVSEAMGGSGDGTDLFGGIVGDALDKALGGLNDAVNGVVDAVETAVNDVADMAADSLDTMLSLPKLGDDLLNKASELVTTLNEGGGDVLSVLVGTDQTMRGLINAEFPDLTTAQIEDLVDRTMIQNIDAGEMDPLLLPAGIALQLPVP